MMLTNGRLKFGKAPVFMPSTADNVLKNTLARMKEENPVKWTEQMKGLTHGVLDPLKLRIDKAKLFRLSSRKRLKDKKLGKAAYRAEVVLAETAVFLYVSLRRMRDKAERTENLDHLFSVYKAASALSAHLDCKNLFLPHIYPKNDPQLLSALVNQRHAAALSLHTDVSDKLGGVDKILGISLPKAPRLPNIPK